MREVIRICIQIAITAMNEQDLVDGEVALSHELSDYCATSTKVTDYYQVLIMTLGIQDGGAHIGVDSWCVLRMYLGNLESLDVEFDVRRLEQLAHQVEGEEIRSIDQENTYYGHDYLHRRTGAFAPWAIYNKEQLWLQVEMHINEGAPRRAPGTVMVP